jgi:hypothetical protein
MSYSDLGKGIFFPQEKRSQSLVGSCKGTYFSSASDPNHPWSRDFVSNDYLMTVNHSYQLELLRKGRGDVGGDVIITHDTITNISAPVANCTTFKGPVTVAFQTGFTPSVNNVDPLGLTVLNAFGASAIARTNPNQPQFSLATALAELRQDGLPTLPGSQLRDQVSYLRGSGSEYLNIEFGWLPLVNDVKNFIRTVNKSHDLIHQYIRDSDRKIRRRYAAPTVTSNVKVTTGGGFAFPSAANLSTVGSASEWKTYDVWFSGAFRYHVPIGDDFLSRLDRYKAISNHLLGVEITPEVLWNLAPWSWAVDWFTNAGDVINNITNLGIDGSVLQYGYVMAHQRYECTYAHTCSFAPNPSRYFGGTASHTVVKETKQRVGANPYGFGITWGVLSNTQLAVLAALGITRGLK